MTIFLESSEKKWYGFSETSKNEIRAIRKTWPIMDSGLRKYGLLFINLHVLENYFFFSTDKPAVDQFHLGREGICHAFMYRIVALNTTAVLIDLPV
jgi:hypothetical protein